MVPACIDLMHCLCFIGVCLSPVWYPTARTLACMLERLPILERLHVRHASLLIFLSSLACATRFLHHFTSSDEKIQAPLFFLPMIPPHLAPPTLFISKHGPFPLPGSVGYTVRDPNGVDWWTVKEEEMKEMRQTLAKLSDIKEVDAGIQAIGTAGSDRGIPAYARDTRVRPAGSFPLVSVVH